MAANYFEDSLVSVLTSGGNLSNSVSSPSLEVFLLKVGLVFESEYTQKQHHDVIRLK